MGSSTLRDGLHRYGLSDISRQSASSALVDNHREIALEATALQLEKLAQGEADTKLAVVGGISTDKVRDREGWKNRNGPEEKLGDRLAEIAQMIIQRPSKLDLHLTAEPVQPSDPLETARDVTPRPGNGSLTEVSAPFPGKWDH